MKTETIADKLRGLARNLWWVWQPDADKLFQVLDPALWSETGHNPVLFLNLQAPDQIERRANEVTLHSRIDWASRRLREYLSSEETWGEVHAATLKTRPVAYFSAEFGLHESLPIYSGGLGVLAGDHLKSASDLGLPLVGVGLMYNQGYFTQRLNGDGWQQEEYTNADPTILPIRPALGADEKQIVIAVDTRAGRLHAKVWRVDVGRIRLLLLDADVPENSPDDRQLTARLYGGDARVRIRQELLLGVGGLRALHALDIHPGVLHMNEGHSAFAALEMIRVRMEEQGDPFGVAARDVAAMTVFTTHTPVAAGHDRFWPDLVEETLGPLRESLSLSYEGMLALGRVHPGDPNEPFCMTVLALKLSRHANGVSALHGAVSREMWQPLYPNRTEEEVPIGHITNGVHISSWLAPQMQHLYDRHLGGPQWILRNQSPDTWEGIETIDAAELWETRQILKAQLIDFVRTRLTVQAKRRKESAESLEKARNALSQDALTIGFARRFATYKRAGLVLSEAERLAQIVNSTDRPIQLIFAGKAHPEDRFGKELIQSIVRVTRDSRFEGRIVFVEGYDINVARHLVQGVDVWLNNPRRPQEASGTSGQKAAVNGVLNFSVLDGWWAEAYDGTNGFAIGRGLTHQDIHIQDDRDFQNLMKVLTESVIPIYYDRDADGLPRRWIEMQKNSIRSCGWRFSATRMVRDYALNAYLPAARGQSCQMKS